MIFQITLHSPYAGPFLVGLFTVLIWSPWVPDRAKAKPLPWWLGMFGVVLIAVSVTC